VRNRLKVLRAERDWTQARLAEEVAVSRQTVNAIETGKYDPSLPLAFRIAETFGRSIEEIFQPDGADRQRPDAAHPGERNMKPETRAGVR
jgi:putative transcriptional regulator